MLFLALLRYIYITYEEGLIQLSTLGLRTQHWQLGGAGISIPLSSPTSKPLSCHRRLEEVMFSRKASKQLVIFWIMLIIHWRALLSAAMQPECNTEI